jgi:Bacterial SH3 domain
VKLGAERLMLNARTSMLAIDKVPAKKQGGRKSRWWPAAPGPVFASAVLVLASGAVSSGHHATPTTVQHRPTTGTSPTATPGTAPTRSRVIGPLTVLSPIGLNVRAAPSKSAKVIGTAAQGVALALVGHTNKDGGWYWVGGATVIGWVTADPRYTAPGRFNYYGSNAFNVLFPAGWTAGGKPRTGVVFRARTSPEEVVITASTSEAKLPAISGNGISEHSSQQVDACGVTAYLYTYTTSSPHRYYADVALSLGTDDALGLKATLTSLSEMKTVLDFVNSISFPLPICVGKPAAKH